jgi:hypothetical protein
MSKEDFVFMSDREKGISSSISTVFLSAFQGKCCQHIADNVQQRYRIKYKLLFWKCAYARTYTYFKVFLYTYSKQDL